jgi:hypothetical protein
MAHSREHLYQVRFHAFVKEVILEILIDIVVVSPTIVLDLRLLPDG